MSSVGVILIFSIAIALAVGLNSTSSKNGERRSFSIDPHQNTFLKDGKPFRYVSGSFHYFRALPETWRRKLRTMRSAGLNAVSTYVEWAIHNPKEYVYSFEGIADIEKFIKIAQEEDLLVILRPGPYICAERDNGGIPYWLFRKYPNIKLRTNDANYKLEVSRWYAELFPRIQPFLYENNGPIIMVQVENEYGAFHACDKAYKEWLRDETEKYVQGKALLFTTDIPDDKISCGAIEGVFATTDFGLEKAEQIDKVWERLRTVQPVGPLVNSEFYPGWLTHWQEDNQRRNPDRVAEVLRKILQSGASVNIYMFFGGTNFGFTAGANFFDKNYTADITSYDYDAPMDEAGDPTMKLHKIRNVISEFLPMPLVPVPDKAPKISLNPVELTPNAFLLSEDIVNTLGTKVIKAEKPIPFEELDEFSGLVLYETDLPKLEIDPTLLTVEELRDRAFIFVDDTYVGTLSRENKIYSLPINAGFGDRLRILVENQGRINFDVANDKKGILGDVLIQQRNGKQEKLTKWTSTAIPLESEQIAKVFQEHKINRTALQHPKGALLNGPVILAGLIHISEDEIHDTYVDTTGWGKGVIFVNGFNLGRYWPLIGPQITLYLPRQLFRKGENSIMVIEYERVPKDLILRFSSTAKLDGGQLN